MQSSLFYPKPQRLQCSQITIPSHMKGMRPAEKTDSKKCRETQERPNARKCQENATQLLRTMPQPLFERRKKHRLLPRSLKMLHAITLVSDCQK